MPLVSTLEKFQEISVENLKKEVQFLCILLIVRLKEKDSFIFSKYRKVTTRLWWGEDRRRYLFPPCYRTDAAAIFNWISLIQLHSTPWWKCRAEQEHTVLYICHSSDFTVKCIWCKLLCVLLAWLSLLGKLYLVFR